MVSHCFGIHAVLFLQAVAMLYEGPVCEESHNEVSQAGNHVVSHCFGIHAGLLLRAEVLCDVHGVAGAGLFHNWLLPHRLDFLQLTRQPDMQHDSLEVLSICAA